MSYVVDIVGGNTPEAYADALALRDELADARDARLESGDGDPFEQPSTQMAELHRRLTARYPCICDDPGGPWSDGPLINNFGQEAATVGISPSRVAEVLPFLIQTSNEMGLWVLDAQDERLHLPDGTTRQPTVDLEAQQGKRWWEFWK